MNKQDLLSKAKHFYNLSYEELSKNGDTIQRREYIYKMIEYIKQYEENGGKHLTLDIYKPLVALKKEYYENLIFTPTVEDIEEMKYWI